MKLAKVVSVLAILLVLTATVLGTACSGSKGKVGPDGVGIQSVVNNGDGTFTITLTDGTRFTSDNLTGPTMPVVQSMTISGLPAKPGDSVTATVVAQSAGGLTLTYNWAASSGWTVQSGGDSSQATIKAPAVYGSSGTATVTVTDQAGRTAMGTIALSTERNTAPIINSLWSSGNPLPRGAAMDLFTSVTDPNGDIPTYVWTVPSGWTIQSGQGTNHIKVGSPDKPLASGYATLAVGDGNGGNATASIYVATIDGSWDEGTLLELSSSLDTSTPAVAVGPGGVVFAVWAQTDGIRYNIWASRFLSATGWGTAVKIETDDLGSAGSPQVGVDSSGNAVAVWGQSDGVRDNIWANRYTPATGWGTAVKIETTDLGTAQWPQIAVDPNGNGIAVWQQTTGTRYSVWANRYVYGGAWGTAQLIETDDVGDAYSPDVAVNASGYAIATWFQYDGVRYNIWSSRYVPGTGWEARVSVEADNGNATYPQVAIDSTGNAIAAWDQSDGIRYNTWANRYVTGTGWGTATPIETSNLGDALFPKIAADANGDAIAVWQQSDGAFNHIWANRYALGAGWGTAELIETDIADASEMQIVMDANGNAIAAWRGSNGTLNALWTCRYVFGIGWATPGTLATSATQIPQQLQIAANSNGDAAGVWILRNTSYDAWVKLFS